MPEVDVVVPVLNGGPGFARCLDALARQRGVRAHVVVVDNGSTDGTAERAAQAGFAVVREPRRSSYVARNAGLRAGTAAVVAFTDADCVPDELWLANGLAQLEQDGLDLCAGRVDHEPGWNLASRYDAMTYLDQGRNVSFGFAATANLLVRRSVLDELGGFRELQSGGDLDLCVRARRQGRRLGYADSAVVRHKPRSSVREILRKSWRLGEGHSRLILLGTRSLRWSVDLRRLAPSPELRPVGGLPMVALDLASRWCGYVARLVGVARHFRTYGWARRQS